MPNPVDIVAAELARRREGGATPQGLARMMQFQTQQGSLQAQMLNQLRLQQQQEEVMRHNRATEAISLLGQQRQAQQAEGQQKRTEQMMLGPVKQGYMRNPENPMEQVVVPGGPAWRELSDKHAKDLNVLKGVQLQTSETLDRIKRILGNPTGFEGNFGGYNAYVTRMMPSEDIQNTGAELEALKSALKSAGASLMRTGGSVGQITEREWPILERLIDNVTPMLGEKAARETLQRVATRMQRIQQTAQEVYKREWADSPFYQEAEQKEGAPADLPPGVDPKLWQFLTPQEKALWKK